MRLTIIDLNDVELRVARGTEELVRSPGYATCVHQKVEVGDAGFAQAWLHPRTSNNRFWQQLGTSPLTGFGKRVRHAGDLAYLHLEHLRERGGRPDQAVFVVPGSYQRPQLSLLLGIAQAAGIVVDALIDSAVAAAATLPPGRYTHVEALLHACIVTHVTVDAQRVVRTAHDLVADTGCTHFERRIVGCIVEAFLRGCRFDPLHEAATEQQLHDRLGAWLAQFADREEITLALDHHGVRHETRLRRDAVVAAIAPLRERLVAVAGHQGVVVDHRLARIPGVLAGWPGARALPTHAALLGCAASPDLRSITGQGVALRTELAVVPPDARLSEVVETAASPPGASHLLCGHVAHALRATPLHLTTRGSVHAHAVADAVAITVLDAEGARLEVVPGASVLLNGRAVTGGARLRPGDHVTIAGTTSLFVPIVVRDRDAD